MQFPDHNPVWRFLAARARPLMLWMTLVYAAVLLAAGLTAVAEDAPLLVIFQLWVLLGFFMFIGQSLRKDALRGGVISELLVSPIPAWYYGSALMRLFLLYVSASAVAAVVARIAYTYNLYYASRSTSYDPVQILIWVALVTLTFNLFWGNLYDTKWRWGPVSVVGITTTVGLAWFLVLKNRLTRAQSPQAIDKAMADFEQFAQIYYRMMVVSLLMLAGATVYCMIRCYRSYDVFLRDQLP